MTSRPVRPRLAPLPREAWSEEVRTMIERTPGGATEPLNIFTTLVRHPTLVRRWLPFGTMLLTGELPPRDRELLILRTAWNCRSEYEWGQHVRIGLAAGLAQEEIDRVPAGRAGASTPRVLSSGSTSRAKSRMLRSASSTGMPAYLKQATKVSQPTRSRMPATLAWHCSGVPHTWRLRKNSLSASVPCSAAISDIRP